MASEDKTLFRNKVVLVGTGIYGGPPPGHFGLVIGRSGNSSKGILAISGVVDADYTGEIKVMMLNLNEQDIKIQTGDRIAQIVIIPFLPLGKIKTQQQRGDKGFGSSGTQAFAVCAWVKSLLSRPLITINIEGKLIEGLLDTGADNTTFSMNRWPPDWETEPAEPVTGIGGRVEARISKHFLRWKDADGHAGLIKPLVNMGPSFSYVLFGRDLMSQMGIQLKSNVISLEKRRPGPPAAYRDDGEGPYNSITAQLTYAEDSTDKLRVVPHVSSSTDTISHSNFSQSISGNVSSTENCDYFTTENRTMEESNLGHRGTNDSSLSHQHMQNSNLWYPTMGTSSSGVLQGSCTFGAWGVDSATPHSQPYQSQTQTAANYMSSTTGDFNHIPPAAVQHLAGNPKATASGQMHVSGISIHGVSGHTGDSRQPTQNRNSLDSTMQVHQQRNTSNQPAISDNTQQHQGATSCNGNASCMFEHSGSYVPPRRSDIDRRFLLPGTQEDSTDTSNDTEWLRRNHKTTAGLQGDTGVPKHKPISQTCSNSTDEGTVSDSNSDIECYHYNDFGDIDPNRFLSQKAIERYLREQELFAGFLPHPFDTSMYRQDKQELQDLYAIRKEIENLEKSRPPLTTLPANHIGSISYIIGEVKVESKDAKILMYWPQGLEQFVLTGLERTLFLQLMRDVIKFFLIDQAYWTRMKALNKKSAEATGDTKAWTNFWRRRVSHLIDENWKNSNEKQITSSDIKRLTQGNISKEHLTQRLLEIQYLLQHIEVKIYAVPSVLERMRKKAQDLLADH